VSEVWRLQSKASLDTALSMVLFMISSKIAYWLYIPLLAEAETIFSLFFIRMTWIDSIPLVTPLLPHSGGLTTKNVI